MMMITVVNQSFVNQCCLIVLLYTQLKNKTKNSYLRGGFGNQQKVVQIFFFFKYESKEKNYYFIFFFFLNLKPCVRKKKLNKI